MLIYILDCYCFSTMLLPLYCIERKKMIWLLIETLSCSYDETSWAAWAAYVLHTYYTAIWPTRYSSLGTSALLHSTTPVLFSQCKTIPRPHLYWKDELRTQAPTALLSFELLKHNWAKKFFLSFLKCYKPTIWKGVFHKLSFKVDLSLFIGWATANKNPNIE